MSDLISRADAIGALCRECSGESTPCDPFLCSEVIAIQKVPPAQPERKRGQWGRVEVIDDDYESGINPDAAICSECGATTSDYYWAKKYMHFCPNCGADMRGGADENRDNA